MSPLLLIVLLVLLLGGGFGVYRGPWTGPYGLGGLMLLVIAIILLLYLLTGQSPRLGL